MGSTRALVLGALVLGALAAEPSPEAEPAACAELAAHFEASHRLRGAPAAGARALALHWDCGAPGRAAAALLGVALRLGLGLRPRLHGVPLQLCELAALALNDSEWVVGVSARWEGEPCEAGGGALGVLGGAATPLALGLYSAHAHLAAPKREEVVVPSDVGEVSCPRGVRVEVVERAELAARLRGGRPFHLLDYALWEGGAALRREAGCGALGACRSRAPALLSVRAVSYAIFNNDQRLAQTVAAFMPRLEHIREILEYEASNMTVHEAACRWAAADAHRDALASWIEASAWNPSVRILLCRGDPDNERYVPLVGIVRRELRVETERDRWKVEYIIDEDVDCSDPDEVHAGMLDWFNSPSWYNLLGVVGRGDGAYVAAARSEEGRRLPLLLYEAAPRTLRPPLWAAAGGAGHLARALRRLLADCGWARVAVLSERTQFAGDLLLELGAEPGLVLRDWHVAAAASREDLGIVLGGLREVNARIVLVNAGPDVAATILSAAHERGMTPANGYAWIVREWRCAGAGAALRMNFYSVSLWSCAGSSGSGPSAGERVARAAHALWPEAWPRLAVPLADALLTLVLGYRALLDTHPSYAYKLREPQIIGDFAASLVNASIVGIRGEVLRYENFKLKEPLVYVAEWGVEGSRPLVTWRVYNNGCVIDVSPPGPYPPLHPQPDGSVPCSQPVGDPFSPRCLTPWLIGAGALAALALVALAGTWCSWRRWLARRDDVAWLRILTRHEAATAVLAAYLVERRALDVREELGSGQFGRVRLAVLRGAGGAARPVAVKALREGAAPAEECELLREACTLASLEHEHVVRLVGVCAADGPPLVLMEHAFFGDLLRYLRARRHLVEEAALRDDEAVAEAAHVSPEALTRLAREAASALGYLAHRGVVHRDVRAANCLVDARRRLKLADFGMARDTRAAPADGAAEYACRRRALLPVLWMAPESLARGVFSPASDVWALGVLALELVTLGHRPYGASSPLQVLHHVAGGGRPDLPPDASPQTRGVVLQCWQREAARRCSAAELVAYLAAHPRALRPALGASPAPGPAQATPLGASPAPGPAQATPLFTID